MIVCIPSEGRVRMCIRSTYVAAQRTDAAHFDLTGDSFSLMQVTSEQVYVFPDEVEIAEGQELTDEILMQTLPLEQFVRVTAEEAVPAALGLLLRLAVADGRITDSELLSIQPALEGRLWQPGIEVKVGDVCRITLRRGHGRRMPCLLSGVRWRSSPRIPCASGRRVLTTLRATRWLIQMQTAHCTPVCRYIPRKPAGNRLLFRRLEGKGHFG